MGRRATEILERDILAGHGLDDLRTRDEHVRGPFRHDDEVRHRGAVHRASGAGTEDRADLRDDPGREDVSEENLRVPTEADDALLNPCASAVVEADDRSADLHRRVHDLDDLVRMHLPEAPAEDGEVLREDEDGPAVDRAVARDDAVSRDSLRVHPEVGCAVLDEGVRLDEAARIEEEIDPLPRGQLPLLVLRLNPILAPAFSGLGLPSAQLVTRSSPTMEPPNAERVINPSRSARRGIAFLSSHPAVRRAYLRISRAPSKNSCFAPWSSTITRAPFVAMSYALPVTFSFPIVTETRFPIVVHCPR